MSWLDELEPGSLVLIESGREGTLRRARVDRVTATQLAVGPSKYRRTNGQGIGDYGSWSIRPQLVEVTPANLARLADQETKARWRTRCHQLADLLLRSANKSPAEALLPDIEALIAQLDRQP